MVLALPPSPLGVLLSACHWQQRNDGVVTCELKSCQNRTWTKPIIQPNHGSNNMPLFFSFFFFNVSTARLATSPLFDWPTEKTPTPRWCVRCPWPKSIQAKASKGTDWDLLFNGPIHKTRKTTRAIVHLRRTTRKKYLWVTEPREQPWQTQSLEG